MSSNLVYCVNRKVIAFIDHSVYMYSATYSTELSVKYKATAYY